MSEVLVLSEMLGTRYPCDWHARKLDLLFMSKIGETIDLAGCNFTPGAVIMVSKYEDKINFINTADPVRDGILARNRKAREARKSAKLEPIVAVYKSMDGLADYIRSLDAGKVLDATQMPSGMSLVREICNLIQILRPEISIDFGDMLADYFRSVRLYWLGRSKPTDAYWEVQGTLIAKREVHTGFVVDGKGNSVRESDYVASHLVLPWRFGRECLANDPEFSGLIERSLKNIESMTKSQPRMKDYLK